jgi:hypothetical protein
MLIRITLWFRICLFVRFWFNESVQFLLHPPPGASAEFITRLTETRAAARAFHAARAKFQETFTL